MKLGYEGFTWRESPGDRGLFASLTLASPFPPTPPTWSSPTILMLPQLTPTAFPTTPTFTRIPINPPNSQILSNLRFVEGGASFSGRFDMNLRHSPQLSKKYVSSVFCVSRVAVLKVLRTTTMFSRHDTNDKPIYEILARCEALLKKQRTVAARGRKQDCVSIIYEAFIIPTKALETLMSLTTLMYCTIVRIYIRQNSERLYILRSNAFLHGIYAERSWR